MRSWWQEQNPQFARGLGGSLLLHALIILALIYGRFPSHPPEPSNPPLVVDLVEDQSQPTIDPSSVASPKPLDSVHPGPSAARTATAPKDRSVSLRELFTLVEKAHEPVPVIIGAPEAANTFTPSLDSGQPNGALGQPGNSKLKDYIRAQVERRWQVALENPTNVAWVISLRLVLEADGSVAKVEVLPDARYSDNQQYLAVAKSARDAALLSSPLRMPIGIAAVPQEIVLDLDSREATR